MGTEGGRRDDCAGDTQHHGAVVKRPSQHPAVHGVQLGVKAAGFRRGVVRFGVLLLSHIAQSAGVSVKEMNMEIRMAAAEVIPKL